MKTTANLRTAAPTPETAALGQALDYFALTKPRITFLVLVTTLVGLYAAGNLAPAFPKTLLTLLGTGMVAGGCSAWNMWLERDLDALMQRTLQRPLPGGRLQPARALLFALLLSAIGLSILFLGANPLSALIAAITEAAYIAVYTPLKTRTWWCTLVGAMPGALPVLIGWAAASGRLPVQAWALFGIVFLWQLPHFYAIGWMYREDYARARFRILPVVDETGQRTARQVRLFTVLLATSAGIPFLLALAGHLYLAGSLLLNAVFIAFAFRFAAVRTHANANRLFLYSIVYLPLLLCLLMLDRVQM
jgi:heme o synthase